MHFAIHCLDTADPSIRQTHYPEHRAYLDAAPLRILIAGPLLDEAGQDPVGSLLVVEADDIEAARTFAAGDPFARHGAWASMRVDPLRIARENR